MASRRTRIKGIANIPQRRKNTTGEEQASPQVKLENANDSSNLTFNIDKILEDKELHLQPNPCIIIKSEEKSGDIIQNLQNCNGDVEQNSSTCDNNYTASANTTALRDVKNEIDYENKVNIQDNSKLDKSNVSQSQQSKLFTRRKYIKPSVSIGTVNRKCKQNIDKEGSDKFQSVASEVDQSRNVCNEKEIYGLEKTVISPQNTLNPSKTSDSKVVQNIQGTTSSLHSSNEIILDETHLTTQNETSPTEKDLKKLESPSVNHCVDLEYPPPPPSPSKINRSRIKAIPRLSYRKASFSASESEDESKRNNSNRNRNDSTSPKVRIMAIQVRIAFTIT
ncbi:hypothetical protein NQ318_001270 [Aromia moschata]|uniref:Exophilin 5 n=1 Tax=Aromia moschata TaxID=1265417 RepID=A0AAV8ZHJ2_9CUCU|nr:hypothetical protein NQ318_001270 [Aromia moschata]